MTASVGINFRRRSLNDAGRLLTIHGLPALTLLLLLACTAGVTDEARRSWQATLRFTATQWLGNRVPSSFVRATCEKAGKILPREARQLEEAVARDDRTAVARFAESSKK